MTIWIALCFPNQYFHIWSTAVLKSHGCHKYFSGNLFLQKMLWHETWNLIKNWSNSCFPIVLCFNVCHKRAYGNVRAMIQYMLTEHRSQPSTTNMPHNNTVLWYCFSIFLLCPSFATSWGPISLHYLHVRSVPEGLQNDQWPHWPSELLSPFITLLSILDGVVT